MGCPCGSLSLHKQRPAILGILGLWTGQGKAHFSVSGIEITDLGPDLIQNLCNRRRLRYKARINSGIAGLGLNASCSARFPLTGLVFNWL